MSTACSEKAQCFKIKRDIVGIESCYATLLKENTLLHAYKIYSLVVYYSMSHIGAYPTQLQG